MKNGSAKIDVSFWDKLFQNENMPWDQKGSPEQLIRFLSNSPLQAKKVFIPGCGAAYEVNSFTEAGHHVKAMDYSDQAVSRAKQQLKQRGNLVCCGDVFQYRPESAYDIVYERAFLAALPREHWSEYFAMLNELLDAGGLVIGFFVMCDEYQSRYPPFCLRSGELQQQMAEKFELLEQKKVANSVKVFADKEYWMVWQKR